MTSPHKAPAVPVRFAAGVGVLVLVLAVVLVVVLTGGDSGDGPRADTTTSPTAAGTPSRSSALREADAQFPGLVLAGALSRNHASRGERIDYPEASQYYRFDFVERLGGSGREDFIVTPYLNSGVSRHGDRISIERKTGRQKYSGTHFNEAVQHAVARGLFYSIMVYDTAENVPEKSVMVRENGVLVAVTDLQSGTWQIARDLLLSI